MKKCGRTAEVIEDLMAALDLCLSTWWVRILTCGCTYLRVLIIIFFRTAPSQHRRQHPLGRAPSGHAGKENPLGHNTGQN